MKKSLAPKTLVDLMTNLEKKMVAARYFFGANPTTQSTIKLLSLILLEVQRGSAGVTLVVEGLFKGRNSPQTFEATKDELATLGLRDLSLGHDVAQFGNGTLTKILTMRVRKSVLACGLAVELDSVSDHKIEKAKKIALESVMRTQRYKEKRQRIDDIEKEIDRLNKARDAKMFKLQRMSAKAIAKAATWPLVRCLQNPAHQVVFA